ncbi:MAG: TerC family protein, partial [Anaerovoracaceae bacterium]
IIGAIVMRFFFIFFGISIVNKFEWMIYVFGAILIFSGVKMFKHDEDKDPHDSRIIKVLRKVMPMTKNFQDEKFFIRENAKLLATPLFAVLILIEFSDIIFAIDSVPAVISITRNLFIVYTSNIFAILGLRQLFFVIEHIQDKFQYVRYGVAIILAFTGVKMLTGIFGVHISTVVSISVILGLLISSVILSVIVSNKKAKKK